MATSEIYTLSLHDALPILWKGRQRRWASPLKLTTSLIRGSRRSSITRSEEHTSELQSPYDLVCRLLLEKKKMTVITLDLLLGVIVFNRCHLPVRQQYLRLL